MLNSLKMVEVPLIIIVIIYLTLTVMVIAFDKERLPNAVEIEIFGLCIHGHQFIPLPHTPKKYAGANDVISIDHVLCFFHLLPRVWCACLSSLTFSSCLVCFACFIC